MAASIILRTFGGVVDKRIRQMSTTFYRPFTPPASWNRLRVAMRVTMSGIATTGGVNNFFHIGLVRDTWGGGNVGWFTDYRGMTYAAASGDYAAYYYCYSTTAYLATSTGLNSANTKARYYFPADASVAIRRFLFVDLIKGSPNWTMNIFYPTSKPLAALDFSRQDLLDVATTETPVVSEHGWTGNFTSVAFTEPDGGLNSVAVLWASSTTPVYLEVCDLAVVKIS